MKAIASPNPSFDDFFLQELVADLELPLYTGDFYGSGIQGRAQIDAQHKRLTRDYAILLDTVSLAREPDAAWQWQDFEALVPADQLAEWQSKWGNPGAWYAPVPLLELQKHAAVLYLMYQAYYHEIADEKEGLAFYYGLLLANPDFRTRERDRSLHAEHMARFKSEPQHMKARVQHLLSTIIEHEVQNLRLQYHVQNGYSLRAGSLLPIMYYQMGVLIRSPENVKRVKVCVNCNAYFWGHGNRRYCYKKQCDRRTVHKQKRKGG